MMIIIRVDTIVYKIKLHMSDTHFNIKRDLWVIAVDGIDLKLTEHNENAIIFDREETIKCISELDNVYVTDQKAKRLGIHKHGTSFQIYVFDTSNMIWQTHLEFQGIDEKSYTFENYELGKYWNKL